MRNLLLPAMTLLAFIGVVSIGMDATDWILRKVFPYWPE